MKQKTILLLTVLTAFNMFLNSQTLSKEVRNDFCINAIANYYYGTDAFRGLMNISAKRIGLNTPLKIENAIQNLCSNIELQNEFFKNLHEISRGLDKEQYISIGMKPQNAKLLNDYIMLKYHVINKGTEKNHLPDGNLSTKNKTYSVESRDNEPALIKDIFEKNGKKYISLDIVQIEYEEFGYKIINQNFKIRTFEISDNLVIQDNNCRETIDKDYLIRNKERLITKDEEDICLFTSDNGIVTEINLGCWN